MFSQKQVAEFKEGFQLMDRDKDGILGKNDLRATYDELGRIASEKELDEMLHDAPGPINFTMLLTMFAERQSGGDYTLKYLLFKLRYLKNIISFEKRFG